MAPEIESVKLDVLAREHEVAAVEEAFARAGFKVEARPTVETRADHLGAAVLPWLVYVVVTVPLGAFLVGFGSAAGKDAWGAVKTWVWDVWEARESPYGVGGTLDVRDPLGTRLVLSPPLPDEALDALAEIDWEAVEGGDLHWDENRGEWRDAMRGD